MGAQRDEGSITAMAVLLVVVLFALSALVIDGGRQLAANRAAAGEAQQAARAGEAALDVGRLRGGAVDIDPERAVAAAEAYMLAAGHPGIAWTSGGVVFTRVAYTLPTALGGIIGINRLRVEAKGEAINLAGVAGGTPGGSTGG